MLDTQVVEREKMKSYIYVHKAPVDRLDNRGKFHATSSLEVGLFWVQFRQVSSAFWKDQQSLLEPGSQVSFLVLALCSEERPWPRQHLQKEALKWGVPYSYRGLDHWHHG